MTLAMPGTVPSLAARRSSAVVSAEVSDPFVVVTTTGIGCLFDVPNGAARAAACELGALAGRNFWLLPWVTLDSEGSCVLAAMAPRIQTRRTSHRKRTLNR